MPACFPAKTVGSAEHSRPCQETRPGSPMDTTSSGTALFAADRAEQLPHPDPQPLPRLWAARGRAARGPAARGQTDLEVFVEKLLNRSDPEATFVEKLLNRSDPEATFVEKLLNRSDPEAT